MTTDVQLNQSKGYYDIDFDSSGDITTAQNLDTQIFMSIYEERRASAEEVPSGTGRRGWFGNELTAGFEQGSKVWLFEQSRVTGSMLAELGVVVSNSLQWMIDDGIAESIIVNKPRLRGGKIVIEILFTRSGSPVDRKLFTLWENTGRS